MSKPTPLLNWQLSDLFAWGIGGSNVFNYLGLKGKFQSVSAFYIYANYNESYKIS